MAKRIIEKVFICPECKKEIRYLNFNTTLQYCIEDGFVRRDMDTISAGAWNFSCPKCHSKLEVDYDNMNVKGENKND